MCQHTRDSSWSHPRRSWLTSGLFTGLDYLHLHAASGAISLFYGLYACLRIAWYMATLKRLPGPEADWVLPALALVTTVRNLTAIWMAHKHHNGLMQRAHVSGALMSVVLVIVTWFKDPCFPQHPAATIPLQATVLLAALWMAWTGVWDNTVNVSGLVGARDEKATQGKSHAVTAVPRKGSRDDLLAMVAYYVPNVVPLWLAMCIAVQCVVGGRGMVAYVLERWPQSREMAYSRTVSGDTAGALGAFAVTLRDRRKISRQTEMALLAYPFTFFLVVCVFASVAYEGAYEVLAMAWNPQVLLQGLRDAAAWQAR